MKAKQGTLVVYPNITAMMCGVWAYFKTANTITLKYTDGTEESCKLSRMGKTDWDNPFSVVGSVQEAARK